MLVALRVLRDICCRRLIFERDLSWGVSYCIPNFHYAHIIDFEFKLMGTLPSRALVALKRY
jgi:hypothetical protein